MYLLKFYPILVIVTLPIIVIVATYIVVYYKSYQTTNNSVEEFHTTNKHDIIASEASMSSNEMLRSIQAADTKLETNQMQLYQAKNELEHHNKAN